MLMIFRHVVFFFVPLEKCRPSDFWMALRNQERAGLRCAVNVSRVESVMSLVAYCCWLMIDGDDVVVDAEPNVVV